MITRHFPYKKRFFLLIFVIILTIAIGLEAFFLFSLNQEKNIQGANISENKVIQYAKEAVAKCKSAPYPPTCYEREVPRLMSKISMEDAFRVTSKVEDFDKGYGYCHVLAHTLASREVRKNPDNWKNVVGRCPSGVCSNGCLHGALQERFRSDSLTSQQLEKYKQDFTEFCKRSSSWNPTGLEQGSCYHALGHLFMYATTANIKKSIQLCEFVTDNKQGKQYLHMCYDGIFMQLYQRLEPEDYALVEGKVPAKEEIDKFCGQFYGEAKNSCHTESWSLFWSGPMQPQEVVRFCGNSNYEEIDRCYRVLIYIVTSMYQLDENKIRAFCDGFDRKRGQECISTAASRFLEVDYKNIPRALQFCKTEDDKNIKEACFQELFSYSVYNYHKNSKEHTDLCNGLPEYWKKKCFAK